MSIKGFNINGSVQKYDYRSLDNLPGDTGLTDQAKRALLACFERVAWIDADGQTYYDALEEALYPQGYASVTNTLVGCHSTNEAITTAIGKPYNATIIADNGYSLTGATVSITMGGTSVTGYYSNGTISIPNVTGDIIISVSAVSAISSITAVFTQGSATIYDTYTLDSLKQYLVVTATYSDSTTATVTDYTLSGDLEAGTSAITVSYGGKTATFNVTVTSRIPSAYRQVEYLQSDLTQALQTNIAARNTRTLCTFQYVAMRTDGGQSFITGAFNQNNQRYLAILLVQDQVFEIFDRNGTSLWKDNVSNPVISRLGKHTVDFNNASHQAIFDGVVKAQSENLACTSGDWPIAIFCRGRDDTSTYLTNSSAARIYSLLYENNDTGLSIGEFIPCYRKSDNVGGMYDLVSETFYTDVLNGNPFVWGAEHWESGT